tara:strand:+ start:58 stop:474 length:417 start_codon:yes stop_codon:yes gene_type:complete
MDDHQPIGSVSFFVNDPKEHRLTDEDIRAIESFVVAAFETSIKNARFSNQVTITGVVSQRGCVVVTISLAAVFFGVTTFLKDYEKIRSGTIQLAKDLNGLGVKLANWKKEHKVWFYRSDEPESETSDKKRKRKSKKMG